MELIETYIHNTVWVWLSVAVILLIAELLTGTMYLLWIAVAAFLTTLLLVAFPEMSPILQVISFAIITLLTVILGKKYFPFALVNGGNDINNPNQRLIGQNVVLIDDFADGVGAVKLGDTRWRALLGEDYINQPPKLGDLLVVLGVDGATLIVGQKIKHQS